MLTAVPDLAPQVPWVQVLGRIAVHGAGTDALRLTGSGQRLLAVLVASGPTGATAERIAEEIWGAEQPNPWRPALRMAVARLRKQLPADWDVVSVGGVYRIDQADGWIDAWRLDEITSQKADVFEHDLVWMLGGQPFEDTDLLEMVGESIQHLRMLQVTVAERFCGQGSVSTSTATCSALAWLVREHPYNDELALTIGRALVEADRRTEALLMLTEFAETYQSDFGSVPPEIAAFLQSSDDHAALPAHDVERPAIEPRRAELPKELRHLSDTAMLGRDQELASLRASRGALVTGVRGSGRSRLLAGLILADPETETTYVVGDDRLDLPLGPFAVAMPELRDELVASSHDEAAGRGEGSVDRAASTRGWRIILANLEGRAQTREQRLVVDDAHLLDMASRGVLRLLIRSNTAANLTFVVSGRSDSDDPDWSDLLRDAARAGLDPIELSGLGQSELEEIVHQYFPDATRSARQGLAADVFEASSGLPAVAVPLIAAADPETLALRDQLDGAPALARMPTSASKRAPEIVAAASVLGHKFSIGALIALTEISEDEVFVVLDDLWSRGMILETDDPDLVRFQHVLVQRAFLEGIPLFRRGQLHRRAAELTTDIHQRADHQAKAAGLVEPETVAASLKASAVLLVARKQWRNVARELLRVQELPGDHLDVESLSMWAAALDRSGSDGSAQRRLAYSKAIAANNWDGALDAALSGLPEAERPDGDAERIAMLEEIPREKLSPSLRFDQVFQLSRQYCLAGIHDSGLFYADQALELASDADEVGLSHDCRWMATRHVEALAHVTPPEIVHQGSLQVRTGLAKNNVVSLAERGLFEAARDEAVRFAGLAADLDDPLYVWRAQGLEAMFLVNDGDFEAGERVAYGALQYADLHDIQLGSATFSGQQIHSYECQGRLAELAPQLEPFRINMSVSMLGRAALALCGDAVGAPATTEQVQAVAKEALQHKSSFSLTALVSIAPLLPEHAEELVAPTRTLLSRFGDNPLVAGFGVSSFGPTTRYVARLTADADEKTALLKRSVAAADAQGPLLWRVRCRLDGAANGLPALLDEATELAAGTGLALVVERHIAALR